MDPTARTVRGRWLVVGVGGVLAVFLLPAFFLKLGLLLGSVLCIGYAVLPGIVGAERARGIALGSTLMLGSLLVSLVLSEFALRIALSDVTTHGNSTDFFARRWLAGEPPPNSLGFRDVEVSPRPPAGVYRIAVIGDSFTYGLGIDRADRWTERLEGLLNASSDRYEVVNFGLPGHETEHHVETLAHVVLPLNPDFVLLQWLSNDVEGTDKSARPRPARLVPSDAATVWLHHHSALYALADQQWRRLQRLLGMSESYSEYMERRFLDPASPGSRAADAALRDFIAVAREAAVGVGIVAFPNLSEGARSVEDFTMGYLLDRVMTVCVEEAIPCLDLREPLLEAVDREGWWANRLDSHPGPLTSALAAKAVAATFADRFR